jgi:hypothetical protein
MPDEKLKSRYKGIIWFLLVITLISILIRLFFSLQYLTNLIELILLVIMVLIMLWTLGNKKWFG